MSKHAKLILDVYNSWIVRPPFYVAPTFQEGLDVDDNVVPLSEHEKVKKNVDLSLCSVLITKC